MEPHNIKLTTRSNIETCPKLGIAILNCYIQTSWRVQEDSSLWNFFGSGWQVPNPKTQTTKNINLRIPCCLLKYSDLWWPLFSTNMNNSLINFIVVITIIISLQIACCSLKDSDLWWSLIALFQTRTIEFSDIWSFAVTVVSVGCKQLKNWTSSCKFCLKCCLFSMSET